MIRKRALEPYAPQKTNRYLYTVIALLLLGLLLVVFIFSDFIDNYSRNMSDESASHLIEIAAQVKLYMEEKIDNDWKVARSVAYSACGVAFSDEQALLALMRGERDIWGITDIFVYTESGYCINADGEIQRNDEASMMARYAIRDGRYMKIVQSTVTYTVPIDTQLELHGSKIVAVSIVQDLDMFIDGMNFASFGGQAFVYLTQGDGAKISQLTHVNAPPLYNVYSLFNNFDCECLNREGFYIEDTAHATEINTFVCRGESGNWYTVIMPIVAGDLMWQLFYWAPEAVVNQTMNNFSNYVMTISILMIALFAVVAFLVFLYAYRAHKRQFAGAIILRERMFDLLVSNTNNAFGLFSVYHPKPLYITSNVKSILGEDYIHVTRTSEGFRMVTASGEDTREILRLNEQMRSWDGKSVFTSDYIERSTKTGVQYYTIRLYPVADNPDEFVGIAQDVTGDRKREDALKSALMLADSANAAKTRFLANMSHDIRTPMNAIVNMTNFAIEAMGDPESQKSYLQTIRESSAHLLHIINDILDMSRIESGQAIISSAPFDLSRCLFDICEIVRPLCQGRSQTFETDFKRVRPGMLLGDSVKLTQVLINLLNNAVKFTPEGGRVYFIAEETQSPRADTAAMRFTVRDTGIGIAKDMIPRVFEAFMRVSNHWVDGTEGTGLGLSICKSYVNAMGGTISCESAEGEGSTFTVELSFARALTGEAKSEKRNSLDAVSYAGMRALICEDNRVNLLIARKLLERMGFHVETAVNGDDGAQKFIASPEGYYDIIYMDIQMPILDGYQATRAIRLSAHPQAKSIPIVAMTANVFTEDIEKSRANGMNGHLGKPVVPMELMETTDRVLHTGGAR